MQGSTPCVPAKLNFGGNLLLIQSRTTLLIELRYLILLLICCAQYYDLYKIYTGLELLINFLHRYRYSIFTFCMNCTDSVVNVVPHTQHCYCISLSYQCCFDSFYKTRALWLFLVHEMLLRAPWWEIQPFQQQPIQLCKPWS